VRVHPVGSGLALKMLSDGDVDVVISHAPDTESRYLIQHPEWVYRKIAINQGRMNANSFCGKPRRGCRRRNACW
jgi:ABC-type tungstate transport system permease subunit